MSSTAAPFQYRKFPQYRQPASANAPSDASEALVASIQPFALTPFLRENIIARQVIFESLCNTFTVRAITSDELKWHLSQLLPELSNNRRQKIINLLVQNMHRPFREIESLLEVEWASFRPLLEETARKAA